MKIKQIMYQRVKNLGNYETERVELVADMDMDTENQFDVFKQLKKQAELMLELDHDEQDDTNLAERNWIEYGKNLQESVKKM